MTRIILRYTDKSNLKVNIWEWNITKTPLAVSRKGLEKQFFWKTFWDYIWSTFCRDIIAPPLIVTIEVSESDSIGKRKLRFQTEVSLHRLVCNYFQLIEISKTRKGSHFDSFYQQNLVNLVQEYNDPSKGLHQ